MPDSEVKPSPVDVFRELDGQFRMSEAIRHGISRYTLYKKMRDEGVLEQVSRGVYRLTEMPPMSNPDLVTVSLRFPKAVVCLISALSFHGLTTQIPHEVSVAVPRDSRLLSLDYPPIHAYKFSSEAYAAGIERHQMMVWRYPSIAQRRHLRTVLSTGINWEWILYWKP